MVLTAEIAKEVSIKKWTYLAETGIVNREFYGSELFQRLDLQLYNGYCPLCEYFDLDCERCPVGYTISCLDPESSFHRWTLADKAGRIETANHILSLIKDWDITKESGK